MVGLGGIGVAEGGSLVFVGGTLVFVGMTVSVNGNGVSVNGSVGTSVGVPKSGIIVTPGVIVGTFGTQSRCPTLMFVPMMQFARCKSATVVP